MGTGYSPPTIHGHFEVIAPGRDEWTSVEGLIVANMLALDRKQTR